MKNARLPANTGDDAGKLVRMIPRVETVLRNRYVGRVPAGKGPFEGTATVKPPALPVDTYFLQQWFSLSDPGVEDALYESPVLRRFAGIDLGTAAASDEQRS